MFFEKISITDKIEPPKFTAPKITPWTKKPHTRSRMRRSPRRFFPSNTNRKRLPNIKPDWNFEPAKNINENEHPARRQNFNTRPIVELVSSPIPNQDVNMTMTMQAFEQLLPRTTDIFRIKPQSLSMRFNKARRSLNTSMMERRWNESNERPRTNERLHPKLRKYFI